MAIDASAPNELKRLITSARDGRCLLRDKWEEGVSLPGRDQLKLAKTLVAIKPARIERHGRRVPCEPDFELKSKDRRRLVEALLDDGAKDGEIISAVPRLSLRTFNRIKTEMGTGLGKTGAANGSTKRQIRPKRIDPLVRPGIAFLDATSGADAEAEKRFLELVGA